VQGHVVLMGLCQRWQYKSKMQMVSSNDVQTKPTEYLLTSG
jgi:hypothetical protein